ncbi:MAG: ribosome maturation factor RimP [Acidimicrobiales bacterium]|jgi:ribosome maturation factor RimP
MAEELFPLIEPVVTAAGVELVDVEYRSGVVLVTVSCEGGVDLEVLTTVNRVVSELLDERDPIPGAYTLEVSSPGVERNLRRPAHFAKAVGETVTVKTRPQVPGDRRLTGTLVSADDTGLELATDSAPGGRIRLAYSDIDRARTVFAWGPAPRPGGARSGTGKTTKTTKKRKQVSTS